MNNTVMKVDKQVLEEQIIAALKTCYDPEIPVDVFELGLIYEIRIDDDANVGIKMLDDEAVGFTRIHPVPRPGVQVKALSGTEVEIGLFPGPLDLESEDSLEDVNRLFLAIVVLVRERLSRPDQDQLAGVAPGLGEDALLSPRLRDDPRPAGPQRPDHAPTVARSRSSCARNDETSSAVDIESAARATRSASRVETPRKNSFTAGTVRGPIENSRIPRPRNSRTSAGSAAISPHTESGFSAIRAASATRATRRSTAGCVGRNRSETVSFARSTASVYWMRSFVPRERKSTSGASRSAVIAAEGTSIIAPSGMSSGTAMPRSSTSSRAFFRTIRTRRISSTPETIGTRRRRLPEAAAASRARSCVENISGRAKHRRTPRSPRTGLTSSDPTRWRAPFLPPRSYVRITTGRGASPSRTWRYARDCSSSEGNSSPSLER